MSERFRCGGTECTTIQMTTELVQSESSIVFDTELIKSILIKQCEARRECISTMTIAEVDDELESAKERRKAAESKLFFHLVEDGSTED